MFIVRIYYFIAALVFITYQSSVLFAKVVIVTLVDGNKAQFTFQQPDGSIQINHYEDGVKIV